MPILEMPVLAHGDVVYLRWHDSSNLPGWVYAPVLLELGEIESAGVVVESSPGLLIITPAINEEGAALNPLAIPTNSIISIRKLDKNETLPETTCRQAC